MTAGSVPDAIKLIGTDVLDVVMATNPTIGVPVGVTVDVKDAEGNAETGAEYTQDIELLAFDNTGATVPISDTGGAPFFASLIVSMTTGSFSGNITFNLAGVVSPITLTAITRVAVDDYFPQGNDTKASGTLATLPLNSSRLFTNAAGALVGDDWGGTPPDTAENWLSQFGVARIATQNFSSADGGVSETVNSDIGASYTLQFVEDKVPSDEVQIHMRISRGFLKFNIAPVTGSAISVTLRIKTSSFAYEFDGTQDNKVNHTYQIYSIGSDLAGAQSWNSFNDILTQISAPGSKLEAIKTATDFEVDHLANGFVDFAIDPTTINFPADSFSRFVIVVDKDIDDIPTPYPGPLFPVSPARISFPDTNAGTSDFSSVLRVIT